MADRTGSRAGAFDANQPYKTFYFVLLLAIIFTFKDIYLSESPPAGGKGKMSSESGSESDGGIDEQTVRQRMNEAQNERNLKMGEAGSRLSAGKLSGPVMKFMYW